jgi:pseudaminic acid synthase
MIKKILKKNKPILIGEISCNHNGEISTAKKIIDLAKKNKIDFVKLQTYTADTITLNSKKKDFLIKKGLWKGYTLWNLYDSAKTPFEWQKVLFKYAKKKNIKCFSTPFDESAVDLLEEINCPIYKIASFEINHIPLIEKVAQTKKPIIISTGISNLKEIDLAYETALKNGAKEISLLYCVSNYPSKLEDFNFKNIEIMKKRYGCTVGFSDHSTDNRIAFSAVLLGADLVEKHIALSDDNKSHDSKFSIKGNEIKKLRDEIDLAWQLRGKNFFHREKSEDESKIYRRSIYASKVIKFGQKFTANNIKVIRPGFGVHPRYYKKLLSKKSKTNYTPGSRIKIQEIK